MAIFGIGEDEEEYNPVLGSSSSFGALGTGSGSGSLGSYKKNDPIATSWDNFKIQFGGSLETVDGLLGADSFLSDWEMLLKNQVNWAKKITNLNMILVF